MKRILVVITIFIILMSMSATVYGEKNYIDIDSSYWGHSYINELSRKGIISGYPDGYFMPFKEVTYAEFIKMIYISSGGDELDQPQGSHWAMNYYYESIAKGIFTGNDVKIRDLDNSIPRSLMALMTANSFSICVKNDSEIKTLEILKNINDVKEDDEYSSEIALSYFLGILNGYPDKSFRPENGVVRGEAAAAISRFISKKKEIEGEGDDKETQSIGIVKIENRDFSLEGFNTVLGYNGIQKIVYSPESRCIGVYSDKIQDMALFIDGNKLSQVVNTEGNFWEENNLFVYVFKTDDYYHSNCKVGIAFGLHLEELYYYTDASI